MLKRQYSVGMSLTKHNKQTHSQFPEKQSQSWYQENLGTSSTDKNLT